MCLQKKIKYIIVNIILYTFCFSVVSVLLTKRVLLAREYIFRYICQRKGVF